MWKLERILVPIDFSECSGEALRAATLMAQSASASVDCVYVTPFEPPRAAPIEPSETLEMLAATEREQLESRLGRFVAGAIPEGAVEPRLEVAFSSKPPAEAIVELAKGHDAIVMGTHGRTGLERARLGSVAEAVLKKASCPVITVRQERPLRAERGRTVYAMVRSNADLRIALEQLAEAGIGQSEIGVLMSTEAHDRGFDHRLKSEARAGAAAGAVAGGVIGWIGGMALLSGGLLFFGPLVVLAAAGTVVGGLIGAGLPDAHARRIQEAIRSGKVLISVQARNREKAERAARALSRLDPESIEVER
jgi:nucleotide-binding universal stress UspA family protein